MASTLTADDIREFRVLVAASESPADEAEMIEILRAAEEAKCALEALQARVSVAFDHSQRKRASAAGVPAERQGRGIAEQVALARRVSPHMGRRLVGLAKALDAEMPHTNLAFRDGHVSEWRATILARETACLTVEDRREVDRELAADPLELARRGDRQIENAARKLAAKLDAAAVVRRRAKAESERRVTIRPAPDLMVQLNVLLPMRQGVAVFASLTKAADAAISTGAATNRGQVMADTLVDRVLAGATAAPGPAAKPAVPVAVNLTMTAEALLDSGQEAAHVDGYGPIPAGLGRALVADALDAKSAVWVRRLFTKPRTGELVAMDSRQRLFPKNLARFIQLRDQFCRNPYCNALIRHIDHVEPYDARGPTSALNGQGLCEACNYAKQAPGWRSRPVPGEAHTVEVTTPTGHTYRSTAPPLRRVVRPRPDLGWGVISLRLIA